MMFCLFVSLWFELKKGDTPSTHVDRQPQSFPVVSGRCCSLLLSSRQQKPPQKTQSKMCGQQGSEKLICKSCEAKTVPVILLETTSR